MKKFSVVTPTLNEEVNLPRLLLSLSKQTQRGFEVIISDGQSQDKTKEKALEYQKTLDLKFVESPKRKLTFQRNYGAKNAVGEYLIFLDADYQAEEEFLEIVSKVIDETKAEIVIPISIPITTSIFWKIYYAIANRGSFLTLILGKPFVVASAICVKKDVFDKVGGYDDAIYIYEDQSLIQQLFKIGAKIVYAKAKVYFLGRRQERDGKVKFIYENSISTLHLIFKGPIKTEIFKYQMGGQEFKSSKKP
ncbi:MAG: glycosyltransferase [Candidatus Levyibacteriota bacterium]